MILASFQVEDILRKARFFQETFLLADLSIEIVLKMPFLTVSNANIKFAKKKLTWRSYTAAEALPTTKRVKIIDKNKFTKLALNKHVKVFVVHVTFLLTIAIHPAKKAQITLLVATEVKISTKYSDFSDIFMKEKALILLEVTKFNQHVIKMQESQQLPYRLIYSLGPVELKTLKTYIKTNLANGFIWPSKSSASAPIFFVRKLYSSFRLCVNY